MRLLLALVGVLTLSACSTFSVSPNSKEQRSERERREADRELEKANAQQNINSLIAQKKETENTFLRKTTLAPGKKVSGFIQFQANLFKRRTNWIGFQRRSVASSNRI
jgi:hypothetical protein